MWIYLDSMIIIGLFRLFRLFRNLFSPLSIFRDAVDRLIDLLGRVNEPVSIVSIVEIRAVMSAAAFFAPQSGESDESSESGEVAGSGVVCLSGEIGQFDQCGFELVLVSDQSDLPPHQFLDAVSGLRIEHPVGLRDIDWFMLAEVSEGK